MSKSKNPNKLTIKIGKPRNPRVVVTITRGVKKHKDKRKKPLPFDFHG
jgi:hypothetical protein